MRVRGVLLLLFMYIYSWQRHTLNRIYILLLSVLFFLCREASCRLPKILDEKYSALLRWSVENGCLRPRSETCFRFYGVRRQVESRFRTVLMCIRVFCCIICSGHLSLSSAIFARLLRRNRKAQEEPKRIKHTEPEDKQLFPFV